MHLWCKILDYQYISYVIRVIVNFVLKFPDFRCRNNKGPSEVNFNDTVKLPPVWCKNPNSLSLSYVSRVIAIFDKIRPQISLAYLLHNEKWNENLPPMFFWLLVPLKQKKSILAQTFYGMT